MEIMEGVFGNRTAGRVLLHIFHYSEIHAAAIAKDYGTAATPIKNQLIRFEEAGILISKQIGKSRVYLFNQKSAFIKPIKELLNIVYNTMPISEKERLFSERRRPRRKGKPVYGRA
ncbi:ArsR family transcriptional regulator [Leptospira sarikeiensis]|uniref:ArsR family transcriptional regulator n=1 Tax=Leptospira sarikeiensis TaxID=2484943 RepID=A0A4R9K9M4_9LEPT|nr:ArsR family transcriptional regulator [Leptospira sarikeiensis]TGL63378.1 ArsR family transcriptional regulator [Leptospira sarikeiensis]